MYCPQCGKESSSGQHFCRSCGANLRIIARAVTLSEAVARSDRGPLPKLKEMMKGLDVGQATEEISRAMEQMNREIVRGFPAPGAPPQTPAQRREDHIVKGTISFFSGIALMIFLYFFAGALVLKVPPEKLARIPFELEPALRVAWLVGLIPTLSGLGRVIAGLAIRPAAGAGALPAAEPQPAVAAKDAAGALPDSVTEHATEILTPRREASPQRRG